MINNSAMEWYNWTKKDLVYMGAGVGGSVGEGSDPPRKAVLFRVYDKNNNKTKTPPSYT